MKPLLIVTFLCFINVSFGDDPGKDKIGSLRVEMILPPTKMVIVPDREEK